MAQAVLSFEGNLTSDPELKGTAEKPRVYFTVAVNSRIYNRDTQAWEDGKPTFISVSAFDRLASNAAASLKKGAMVSVVGNLRTWEENVEGLEYPVTRFGCTATNIAASLAYATVDVTKNTKSGGNSDWAAEEPAAKPAAKTATKPAAKAAPKAAAPAEDDADVPQF